MSIGCYKCSDSKFSSYDKYNRLEYEFMYWRNDYRQPYYIGYMGEQQYSCGDDNECRIDYASECRYSYVYLYFDEHGLHLKCYSSVYSKCKTYSQYYRGFIFMYWQHH